METACITIEFACSEEGMVRDRIESVHFERYGMTHEILSIEPGRIPEGHDECDLGDYRRIHDLPYPSTSNWIYSVPDGCTSYVARVRVQDAEGAAMTRERILSVPFGDRDLGFSIDRVGEA